MNCRRSRKPEPDVLDESDIDCGDIPAVTLFRTSVADKQRQCIPQQIACFPVALKGITVPESLVIPEQ
jgi:hypothetical protein